MHHIFILDLDIVKWTLCTYVLESLAYICASLSFSAFHIRQARLFPALMQTWTKAQMRLSALRPLPTIGPQVAFFTSMYITFFLGNCNTLLLSHRRES